MAASYTDNDLVKANDLLLYIFTGATSATSVPVAFGTSAGIQIDGQTISANNKMACKWQTNMAGNNSYTVSSDSLYTDTADDFSFDDLLALQIAGNPVKWALAQPTSASTATCPGTYELDSSKVTACGSGLITSLSLNAGVDEVASCSATITGSGAIYQNLTNLFAS